MAFARLVLFLVLCVLPAERASAQDSDVARALADFKADYEKRLATLEEEVRELRGGPHPGVAPDPEHTDPPFLVLRGFGNLNYETGDSRSRTRALPDDSGNAFSLGDLDLFMTSEISSDITFLAETLFEFVEDGSHRIDVERLQVRYAASDWFVLSGGRGHSPVGYWNRRFHHGAWMLTTADRPLIYQFEDEAGLLPMHFVGAQLEGNVELGSSALGYVTFVGNGRGETADEIQLVVDENASKAVGTMLLLKPRADQDWGIGLSAYRDVIPAAPDLSATRAHSIEETILGGFLFYEVEPFELLAEVQFLSHDDETSDRRFNHEGGYVQASRAFGAWRPYYRYDFQNLERSDPYFADPVTGDPLIETKIEHTLGLRWDVRAYLALKAELRYARAASARERMFLLQSAFAF